MKNITSATTKDELMKAMKGILPKLRKLTTKQAKDLADTISYASNMYKKDPAKVTKKDMLSALTAADKMLAMPASATSEPATPKTKKADEKKPALTKNGQKVADKKQTENLTKKKPDTSKAAKSKSDEEEAPKATTKGKTSDKKSADKKPVEKKPEEKKKIFPDTFTTETEDGEVTYEKCPNIKSMDELVKLLSNEDETYIFAFYQPKDMIKKAYPRNFAKAKAVKSFENDLDLTIPVYVSDEGEVIYCVSLYTEVFYDIMSVEVTEDDKFAGGIAYQIYKEA